MTCRKAGLRPGRHLRPVTDSCRRFDRRAASRRTASAGCTTNVGDDADAVVDERRHRHLLGIRRRLPDGAGRRRRDRVSLSGRRGRGVRRHRTLGRRSNRANSSSRKPMPSMPVGFWGDADGSRYRAAYFDTYPGVWRHGDWITLNEDGSCSHHRSVRRHVEPRRSTDRHQRDLSGRRSRRRRRRQPDRAPRGPGAVVRVSLVLFVGVERGNRTRRR